MGQELTDLEAIERILRTLRSMGIEKVNFAGGEPLLHPLINQILRMSKEMGFVVSIITNGSLLNGKLIDEIRDYVDWIGVSIDSDSEIVESRLGRGFGRHVAQTKEVCDRIKRAGIRLKVDTVVTRLNYQEDLRDLIEELQPERWKVFQCLHICGQNDEFIDKLAISSIQFEQFKQCNMRLRSTDIHPVFEKDIDMVSSYLMLSPSGELMLNHSRKLSFLPLDKYRECLQSNKIDINKYVNRGGAYDWGKGQSEARDDFL